MAATDPAASPPAASIPRRRKDTRRSVLIADKVADWTITIGGLFVIIAVFGIMAFLAQVVVPLFTGGHVQDRADYAVARSEAGTLTVSTDEYRTIGVKVGPSGTVIAFHLPTGRALEPLAFDFGDVPVTGFGRTLKREDVAFGFADGSIRFGRMRMATQVLPADQLLPA